MDRRPSGLPRKRVFPPIGRTYDYDRDVAGTNAVIRTIRRTVWPLTALIAVLCIVLAIAGKGDTAGGVIALVGVPLFGIAVVNEILAFFHRRRS